jgi:hypothetical protein
MMFSIDAQASRARHEEMLREAAQARLARQARKANGTESLLSRMVKLLARSNRQLLSTLRSEKPEVQHPLANAKLS